jgi:hypothetical protein
LTEDAMAGVRIEAEIHRGGLRAIAELVAG